MIAYILFLVFFICIYITIVWFIRGEPIKLLSNQCLQVLQNQIFKWQEYYQ